MISRLDGRSFEYHCIAHYTQSYGGIAIRMLRSRYRLFVIPAWAFARLEGVYAVELAQCGDTVVSTLQCASGIGFIGVTRELPLCRNSIPRKKTHRIHPRCVFLLCDCFIQTFFLNRLQQLLAIPILVILMFFSFLK